MPELPEVETIINDLRPLIEMKTISKLEIYNEKTLKNISKEEFITQVNFQKIISVSRRAKYLIFELSDYFLVSHLRMEGKWQILDATKKIENENHILMKMLLNEQEALIFYDFRKFATIDLVDKLELDNFFINKKIGPEPWDIDLEEFYSLTKKSKRPIKSFILDQKNIAGIGNIYADEILYASKIHPLSLANTLPKNKVKEIVENSVLILRKSISLGGTSIRTYSSIDNQKGKYQNELQVHMQQHKNCFDQKHFVNKIKVNGRGTYYCEGVQKIWN